MKNKNITLLFIIVLLLNICLFSNISFAATDSYSMTLIPDKQTIKAGDTISIAVKISNINIQTGEKGIGAYEATLVYDSNVFSSVQFAAASNWDSPTYNISNGKFASVRSDATCSNESQNVAIIKLTVKDSVSAQNTTISLKNISCSNGESTISTKDISTTLNISSSSSSNNSNNSNNTNNNNNPSNNNNSNNSNTTNNSSNNNSSNNNKNQNNSVVKPNNSTTNNSKLPQTGEYDFIIFTIIIVLIVIGIYGYFNFRKYKGI